MTAVMTQRTIERSNKMQMYKIELLQVRKLTVYCSGEKREDAEKWLDEHRDEIFDRINGLEDDSVYCFTTFTFSEDNTNELISEQGKDNGATN